MTVLAKHMRTAGSMKRNGVCLPVCLSHSPAARCCCCGFAAVGRRAGDIDQSRRLLAPQKHGAQLTMDASG